MNKKLSVSLIICTYNREELLVQSLKCALKQTYGDMEILVIDQTEHHDEETMLYLDSIKDKIKYTYASTPSLTKARNLGIDSSTGDLIIFIDDDVILEEDFVSHHVQAHSKYDVVQGRVIEDDSPPTDKPHWVNRWIKYSGSNNCIKEGKTNVVTGCNFSIKRSVVDVVGYFDEFFSKLALREDSDYGLRCYEHGLAMGFSPEAKLIHLSSPSGGCDTGIRNMFFADTYYRNDMYFARKHFSTLACMIYKYRLYRRGCREIRKLINMSIADSGNK